MLKSLLNKKNNKGFTLVELIVVIAIMAILAVAVTPKLTHFLENSKVAADKEIVNTICTAFTTATLDADLYDTMPTDYKRAAGVIITAAPTSGTDNYKFYFKESSDNKYDADGASLTKFEEAVKGILPAKFELKSKTWTATNTKITVFVTGQGEVKVELSDGAASPATPTVYTAEKN